MADLKSLKVRINSIKKTQKITKAMKMVAASKLRRAREAAEFSRDYAGALENIISAHIDSDSSNQRNVISGVDNPKSALIILVTTDRGLCGGLNTNLVKATKARIKEYKDKNIQVNIICIGSKGYDQLKADFSPIILKNQEGYSSRAIDGSEAKELANFLIESFKNEKSDICEIIYPEFKSAISQEVTRKSLIPCTVNEDQQPTDIEFIYEPQKEKLLKDLVEKNIAVQITQSFVESYASEQGARMTAMDNAVNNCTEMVKKLNLVYNRTRQAKITTELVEIISAAESI